MLFDDNKIEQLCQQLIIAAQREESNASEKAARDLLYLSSPKKLPTNGLNGLNGGGLSTGGLSSTGLSSFSSINSSSTLNHTPKRNVPSQKSTTSRSHTPSTKQLMCDEDEMDILEQDQQHNQTLYNDQESAILKAYNQFLKDTISFAQRRKGF